MISRYPTRPGRMILATNYPFKPLHEYNRQNLGFGIKGEGGLLLCKLLLVPADRGEMRIFRKWSINCFTGRSKKEQKVEVDSINGGGQDVFDPDPVGQPDHLVIMVNGIIGR